MAPVLLKPEVAHPVAVKTEIGARRTRAKQYYDRHLGGKAHEEIQPGQWVYAKPNPKHKHSAWPHGLVQKVSSPRSYIVVTHNGREMRRNRTQIRLAAAPPPDAKTYMSQQPSASCEDDQPSGQPLPTLSAPMTPQNHLQSSQQLSKDRVEYQQSRTDIQTRGCTEPYNHSKGPSTYGEQLSSRKMGQLTVKQRALQH